MKFFNITLFLVVLALACCLSLTYAQEDGAAPTALKRPGLRRPVGGKIAKTTTTTQAPQPQEDEGEYNDEVSNNQEGEEGDENEENDAPQNNTPAPVEAPKKVIGPLIRPFRSNDDFWNSLKRRQQDAKKHRAVEKPTPRSKPSPANDEDGDEGAESAPAPAPAKGYKAGSTALNRRKVAKLGKHEPPASADDTAAAESEQEPKEQARRPSNSRLALRKRN